MDAISNLSSTHGVSNRMEHSNPIPSLKSSLTKREGALYAPEELKDTSNSVFQRSRLCNETLRHGMTLPNVTIDENPASQLAHLFSTSELRNNHSVLKLFHDLPEAFAYENMMKYLKDKNYHALRLLLRGNDELVLTEKSETKWRQFELHTTEQLNIILNIVSYYKEDGTRIREGIAGTGILTDLLNAQAIQRGLPFKLAEAFDSNIENLTASESMRTLTLEKYNRCKSYKKDQILILSWPRHKMQNEILQFLRNDPNRVVILLGEKIGDSCLKNEFTEYVHAEGLKLHTLEYKSLSQNERMDTDYKHTCRIYIVEGSKCKKTLEGVDLYATLDVPSYFIDDGRIVSNMEELYYDASHATKNISFFYGNHPKINFVALRNSCPYLMPDFVQKIFDNSCELLIETIIAFIFSNNESHENKMQESSSFLGELNTMIQEIPLTRLMSGVERKPSLPEEKFNFNHMPPIDNFKDLVSLLFFHPYFEEGIETLKEKIILLIGAQIQFLKGNHSKIVSKSGEKVEIISSEVIKTLKKFNPISTENNWKFSKTKEVFFIQEKKETLQELKSTLSMLGISNLELHQVKRSEDYLLQIPKFKAAALALYQELSAPLNLERGPLK